MRNELERLRIQNENLRTQRDLLQQENAAVTNRNALLTQENLELKELQRETQTRNTRQADHGLIRRRAQHLRDLRDDSEGSEEEFSSTSA